MGSNVDFLSYIVLLVLLAFIVMNLHRALGRRTGHERQRPDPFTMRRDARADEAGTDGDDKILSFPMRDNGAQEEAEQNTSMSSGRPISDLAPEGSPQAKGLLDIQLADRSFEPDTFINGAKSAYEMIVTAFAEGDRRTLSPLLSAEVMQDFEAAIKDRESRQETVEFTFVGLNATTITDAQIVDRVAEITVRFVSEVISVKKNSDGAVIEGDPSSVRQVTDNWTFARDTRSGDPNWHLVATQG